MPRVVLYLFYILPPPPFLSDAFDFGTEVSIWILFFANLSSSFLEGTELLLDREEADEVFRDAKTVGL